jgi:uncharacterized membrane protein YdbT with pleckstrin-like domain
MHRLGPALGWLVVIVLSLLFAIFSATRYEIEAIAVKQDGHILIVRSIFLRDRVEECTEDKLKLVCQPYDINFQQ